MAIWLLAVGLGPGAVPSSGATVTLKPVADTSLFEFAPTNNLGAVTTLPVGTINRGKRCRLLLRFDLAGAIPADAAISRVSLAVTVNNSGAVDSVFELHRVLQPWLEGAKSGSNNGEPATDGEPTWLARAHPGLPWAEPGGAAGADFASTPSAALLLSAPGSHVFANTPALVSDVQGWLAEPGANHGWLVLSRDEATASTAKRLNSREALDHAPALSIDYAMPLPLPHIDKIELAGDEVRLLFPVLAGKLYAVEYVQSRPGGAWQTLSFAGSKFFATNWVTTDSRLNAAQRFYRLARLGDID